MLRPLVIATCGWLFLGCAPRPVPNNAPRLAAGRVETIIPALGVALSLPEEAEVVYLSGGAMVLLDGRVFSLEEWPSAPLHPEPAAPAVTRTLANGAVAKYLVQSLGPSEAALSGAVEVGETAFAIHCHDSGTPPRPEWCLDYLATLRLTGR
jgi:hypothetical protein